MTHSKEKPYVYDLLMVVWLIFFTSFAAAITAGWLKDADFVVLVIAMPILSIVGYYRWREWYWALKKPSYKWTMWRSLRNSKLAESDDADFMAEFAQLVEAENNKHGKEE